ncbi:MAG TPA: hypothetical protein VIS74_01645 [Chthoniobacterales bacterium]
MVKTQIQLPEELYQELRSFAKNREWSLAETFRRGAEMLLEVYPAHPVSAAWEPPRSQRVGWKGLSAEQLHDLALADQEGPLPSSR